MAIANTEMSNMYSYILFLFYFLQISQQEMEENTKVCTFQTSDHAPLHVMQYSINFVTIQNKSTKIQILALQVYSLYSVFTSV